MLDPGEEYHDLATLVVAKSAKNGAKIAVRFGDRSWSYRELDRESLRVASGLRAAGIGHGDRVAALLFNSPEFLSLWFGLSRIGAVLVPLNTALKGDLLRYQLLDASPRAIVVDARLWPAYAAVRVPGQISREWVREPPAGVDPNPPGIPRFATLPSDAPLGPVEPPQRWEAAAILYTSGTTGPAKGVLVPHEGYLATSAEIGRRSRLHEGAILFTGLPLFHCNAQEMTTLAAMLNDLTAAFEERFHASTYWETAASMGATHVSLLISMINVLFKQPEKPTDRRHSVRVALTAGTTKQVWPDFEKRFGLTVIELYGMTECGCTTLMNPPNAIRVGSIGTPLDFVEADVVDDHDRPIPVGERGELVVRPRRPFTMFLGYLNKPEQTVEAWRNLWFHTGDYVTRDADGYYYFVDRKKDVIRRRGENIAPYDVESALNRHPAVFESVVVAVPSALGEDDVKAFVQLKPGATVDPTSLFEFAREHLPFFMVPKYIEFLDEIPKTANQKSQRYLLRGRRGDQEHDRDALGVVVRKP